MALFLGFKKVKFPYLILLACLALLLSTLSLEAVSKGAQIYTVNKNQKPLYSLGAYGVSAVAVVNGKRLRGTYISYLAPGSVAVTSGVRVKDVILSINEKVTHSPEVTRDLIEQFSNRQVRVKLARVKGESLAVETINARWQFKDRYGSIGNLKKAKESIEELESFAFRLLNEDRKRQNVKPVVLSKKLSALARRYADEMSAKEFFSHVNPEGKSIDDRVKAAGIFADVHETLAYQKGNHFLHCVRLCQKAFMDEPAGEVNHRSNILDPNNASVGIGVALMKRGEGVILVQEFSFTIIP